MDSHIENEGEEKHWVWEKAVYFMVQVIFKIILLKPFITAVFQI